jgi:hypothetical protein
MTESGGATLTKSLASLRSAPDRAHKREWLL